MKTPQYHLGLTLKIVLTFMVLSLNVNTLLCQTKDLKKIIAIQDNLIGFDLEQAASSNETLIKNFWKFFKIIRDDEIKNNILNGNINFGFNGDQASKSQLFNGNNNSVYLLNGGLSFTRGSYPNQLRLSTDFNISAKNGKFNEEISNLNIAYDQHISSKNDDLRYESFIFMNRRSDRYLGLDQRYEMGGGIVIAKWSKKLPEKFEKEKAEFDKLASSCSDNKDSLFVCLNIMDTQINKNIKALLETQNKYSNRFRKKNAPLRYGILFGVFVEIEKMTIADSLNNNEGKRLLVTESFDATTRLRWELRPTFDIKLFKNSVDLKIRPYFKLPVPWNWTQLVDGKKEIDYRIDFPISLEIAVSDLVTLELNHTIYYDNTPPSIEQSQFSIDDDLVFLTGNKLHQLSRFKVKFSINRS